MSNTDSQMEWIARSWLKDRGVKCEHLADLVLFLQRAYHPLLNILNRDEPLYGVDEIIALSIVNVYGSIGLTNYGYIDKMKPGILQILNDKSTGSCHTFLDDIVGAIAAAASSRLAHHPRLP
ncbi:phosphatidylglycerophosphatase A [Terrilactibacillus sp. S3-3]|nr:phosphatidylglycerophosphatase A [Terrilactibacillus sp. S3-3]